MHIYACEELQRASDDIPSILNGSLTPNESPLYSLLKEEREVVKANYEAGLIDLDGYLGKVGSISLNTGKSKFSADDEYNDSIAPKRKAGVTEEEPVDDANPPNKRRRVGAAIRGRRGRPARNTGKDSRNVNHPVSMVEPSPEEVPSLAEIPAPAPTTSSFPWPNPQGLEPIPNALPATSARTSSSAVPRLIGPRIYSAPISLSSIAVFNNSLVSHIERYNLGLRERSPIAGDGNCWFSSNADLAKEHKLKVPEDPNQLRIAVMNSLKTHPQKPQWVRSLFNGKARSFNIQQCPGSIHYHWE